MMYHDVMSMKFQMTLPDELAFRLKQAASERDIPLAQFIRETMEEQLRRSRSRTTNDDPFAGIRDLVESDERDLSSRVDEVLYGGSPHE